jgi:peroxiredoxin
VQLQSRAKKLDASGIKLFAISYDPVPVLAKFAEQNRITYPLLSDEGSTTIRRLGLLNQHVAQQQVFYGRTVEDRHQGIPYPGTFVLDEQGVVVNRQFDQSYRVRPAPDVLLEELVPMEEIASVVSAESEREGVHLRAWLATDHYRPYERLHMHVKLSLAPGLHVYAAPAPEGLTALSVELAPIASMDVEPLIAPEPHLLSMDGMPDMPLYEGSTSVTLPFHIDANEGDQTLRATVRYQACTDAMCYPPEAVTLELALKALDMVRP